MAQGAGITWWVATKLPVSSDSSWPRGGAPSIDFIATLLTAGSHLKRLLRSRQIEQSSDRTQSEAVVQLGPPGVGRECSVCGPSLLPGELTL
jgi:hypothetical protein